MKTLLRSLYFQVIAAIVLGVTALRQIRRTGERGAALAAAGLAIATLGLVLTVLLVL